MGVLFDGIPSILLGISVPEEKLNIDAGVIALGYPLGAPGTRLLGKAATLLKREKAKRALATQCAAEWALLWSWRPHEHFDESAARPAR
jgi:acetyl-CoA acetyltransferase